MESTYNCGQQVLASRFSFFREGTRFVSRPLCLSCSPLGYSIRSVSETLNWLLKEALKYYPQAITWLKMKGDVELGKRRVFFSVLNKFK